MWITGRRRSQGGERVKLDVLEFEPYPQGSDMYSSATKSSSPFHSSKGRWKLNPLAYWSFPLVPVGAWKVSLLSGCHQFGVSTDRTRQAGCSLLRVCASADQPGLPDAVSIVLLCHQVRSCETSGQVRSGQVRLLVKFAKSTGCIVSQYQYSRR